MGKGVYVSFKGSDSEYRMLHYWVEDQLGKPAKCETCKTTEKSVYHWANISGEYKKDVSDWKRLCVRCHMKLDGRINTHCKRGHELTPVNTRPATRGGRRCLVCQRMYRRNWYQRSIKANQ